MKQSAVEFIEINTSKTGNLYTLDLTPKVTFMNELWVGSVKVAINTEINFSGVHPLQHERVLDIVNKIYNINRKI